MRWYAVAPSAVLAVLMAVTGIAAIRIGWLLPWLRKRTFRPRLQGYAHLLVSVFLAFQVTGAVFAGSETQFLFIGPGWVLMLIATGLMFVAQRPRRAR